MIAQSVRERAAGYRAGFDAAAPFRHVAIDGFLDGAALAGLIEQFPPFDPACAVNEFGEVGGKDVHVRLSDIGPAYRDLARLAASPEMTALLGEITGIDGLVWGGEDMYGGGTHENLNGQGLAAHIDFNRDGRNGRHRRLNLLLYLNPEWVPEWGGALELHADPRDPGRNWHVAYDPLANRAVIHETTERSWHGFRPIVLPPDKPHLSRRSVALYFYTADRPAEERAGSHTTHYVLPPVPDFPAPGRPLGAAEIGALREQIDLRDRLLALHQRLEVEAGARADALQEAVARLRLAGLPPRYGYVDAVPGSLEGIWDDGWIGPRFAVRYRCLRPLRDIAVRLFIPEGARGDYRFRLACAGRSALFRFAKASGERTLTLGDLGTEAGAEVDLVLETLERPPPPPDRQDLRDLSAVVTAIVCGHGEAKRRRRAGAR